MEHKNHRTGLTDAQVLESRKKYGENVLTPPEKEPLWKLFLEKFEDPIIRILLIAAFLSLGIAIKILFLMVNLINNLQHSTVAIKALIKYMISLLCMYHSQLFSAYKVTTFAATIFSS